MIEDGFYIYEDRLILLQDGDGFEVAQGLYIDANISGNKLSGPVYTANRNLTSQSSGRKEACPLLHELIEQRFGYKYCYHCGEPLRR